MSRVLLFFLGLTLLASCSNQETEILSDDDLRAKKQAIEDLLIKYEVQDVIRPSDKLEEYRGMSVEETERKLKVWIALNKKRIQRQKEQLKKEEEMARIMPEYIEKIKNAKTEEERRAIAEEYRDVLNIQYADEPAKN